MYQTLEKKGFCLLKMVHVTIPIFFYLEFYFTLFFVINIYFRTDLNILRYENILNIYLNTLIK